MPGRVSGLKRENGPYNVTTPGLPIIGGIKQELTSESGSGARASGRLATVQRGMA